MASVASATVNNTISKWGFYGSWI